MSGRNSEDEHDFRGDWTPVELFVRSCAEIKDLGQAALSPSFSESNTESAFESASNRQDSDQ